MDAGKLKYDNYVFDLYGTLIDIRTDEEDLRAWEKLALLFRYHGADYEAAELRGAYKASGLRAGWTEKRRRKPWRERRLSIPRRFALRMYSAGCMRRKGCGPERRWYNGPARCSALSRPFPSGFFLR